MERENGVAPSTNKPAMPTTARKRPSLMKRVNMSSAPSAATMSSRLVGAAKTQSTFEEMKNMERG